MQFIALPPPDSPYGIETMEPTHAPPHLGWGDEGSDGPRISEWPDDQPAWQPQELPLDDGRVLFLDGDPLPEDCD